MSTVRLLNFGCGAVFHPEWINLDTSPVSPAVSVHDLRKGFPFPADTFVGVYGAHVLEHLDVDAAQALLFECCRVLKPGGIVRIVVPDLEKIATMYIASLNEALRGDSEAKLRYDWLMLELYDQTVRNSSGGKMASYMNDVRSKNHWKFILSRIGTEAMPTQQGVNQHNPFLWRTIRWAKSFLLRIRYAVAAVGVYVVLGPKGNTALREGLFRQSGEIHQWMYDRFSLTRALAESGFLDIRISVAGHSEIPGFAGHGLEVLDGKERKPDSLYMEARKPLQA